MSIATEIYSPGLPQGVGRHHIMDLVERLARPLNLTHTAVLYLRALARTTKHADWTEKGRGPVCYVRQRDISEEIGIYRRSANRIEARLAATGLLKILRLDNGHRSGHTGRTGETGVFLAPLIDSFADLEALHEEIEARQRALKAARARASVARSELRRAISEAEDQPPAARDAAQATLDAEPSRLSTLDDADELDAIADRLRAALGALMTVASARPAERADVRDSMSGRDKMSPACDAGVPRHIHNTSNPENVTCIKRPAVPAEIYSPGPDKSGQECLEDKHVEPTPPGKAEVEEISEDDRRFEQSDGARIPPAMLYRAASEEFRMYADAKRGKHPVSYSDLVFAADIRRQELRIRNPAWTAAGDALGYFDRAAAVLVLDRNTDHPTHRVKNPGGALIGMVQKARVGELRLASSIIGILERARGGEA